MVSAGARRMQSYQRQHQTTWASEKADDRKERDRTSVLRNTGRPKRKNTGLKDLYYFLDLRDGKMSKETEKTGKSAPVSQMLLKNTLLPDVGGQLDVYA